MAYTQVTVTGTILLSNATPASGASVNFTLNTPISDGTSVVAPAALSARCAADGTFSITVNANDDSTTTPTGTYYAVAITYGTQTLDSFNVIVPRASAPTVGLFTLAQLSNPNVQTPFVQSFNGRNGIVTPGNADYLAVASGGLPGATAAGRYVGTTTSGPPTSGTFLKGDWVTDQAGKRWTCTTAGTPGAWTQEPGSGGSGVSSAALGYKSLRGDFALNPSMSASALTTGIQNAINSLVGTGFGLDLGADQWQINAPLAITGALAFRAAGAAEVWSNVQNSSNTEVPGAAPWYQGGGLIQTQSAADILQVTAPGVKLDLKSIILAFSCGAATFANTGHAVNGALQGNFSGLPDNGITAPRWDDVLVFGHDGNHYAFNTVNMNYATVTHARTYGGGGFLLKCQNASSGFGNNNIVSPYVVVFCNGTADGYRHESTDNGSTYGGTENLNVLVRPQCNLGPLSAGVPLKVAFPQITDPATTSGIANQFTWRDINTAPRNTTLSAALSTAGSITALPVNATTAAVAQYQILTLNDGAGHTQPFTVSAATGAGATSIPVYSLQPNFAYPASTTSVFSGKPPQAITVISPDLEGTGADFLFGAGTVTLAQTTNDPRNGNLITTLGVNALPVQNNATQKNTAIGANALVACTASGQNVAVGSNAAANVVSATQNTVIGDNAGGGLVNRGFGNVVVGQGAKTSGDNLQNVMVGQNAQSNQDFGVAIGANSQVTGSGGVAIGIDNGGGSVSAGQNEFVLGTANHQVKISNNATGTGSAALGANSPAVTNAAPYTWLKMKSSDGSTVYVPAWK